MSDEEFPYQEFAATLGYSLCFSVVTYPMEFAEFLMQIGYTPIPGYPKRTMIGLRNSFKYVGHIRQRDGFFGCYRGFLSKLRTRTSWMTASAVFCHKMHTAQQQSYDAEDLDIRSKFNLFGMSLLTDIAEKTLAILVSQPFLVISWRVMGQFVGQEQLYSGFFRSIGEIYRRNGLAGFFTGIIPRWLGEIIAHSLSKTISFLLNNFIISEPLLKAASTAIIYYICYGLTYPFTVAAVCYGVNDSGLVCGEPPAMPIFDGWREAWAYLRSQGRLYSKVAPAT